MNKSFLHYYSPYLDSTTKRCFDVFVRMMLLPSVILTLLVILAVVFVVDGRPVLFFQRRVGKNNEEFVLPKIRTLKKYAHPDKPTHMNDISTLTTKTGKFLRIHRLDELPQIFSVLMGKMSLVGPRPELPNVINGYSQKERRRLCVCPGLTGLWQIRASRKQPIHENIQNDFYYLRKANLWLDIRILAETVSFVLKAESDFS